MTTNKVLMRLKDTSKENMIDAFYTENPSEFLKMYYFCKENDIPISNHSNKITGDVEDIEVSFGGEENLPYIDVWINVW